MKTKEFIRLLKEKHKKWREDLGKGLIVDSFESVIDKLAEDELK